LARLRLDPNPAAVHLDDALRYGKSQSSAAFLAGDGIVGLLELLKQLGLIGCGDARASIADRHMERAIVRFSLDGDFAGIGELDGVADEIDQDLRQAAAIAVAEQQISALMAGAQLAEEAGALGRQHHMASLAAFRLGDDHGVGIRVEVVDRHLGELGITTAGFQRRPH